MRQRAHTDDMNMIGRRNHGENEMGASDLAEGNVSEHRGPQNIPPNEEGEDAIYEMPDEDGDATSPPDSLSHNQDVVSEHIAASKTRIHKFGGNKPKDIQSVAQADISDTVSRDVQQSNAKNVQVPREAQISARVELVETSRSIQTFDVAY